MRTTRSQAHQEPTYSTEHDSDDDSDASGASASHDHTSSEDAPAPEASLSRQVSPLPFVSITVLPDTRLVSAI